MTNQADVFYILAKGYLSHELGMLGFPAYDRSQLLLGFYKEVQSQAGQTQVKNYSAVGDERLRRLFCKRSDMTRQWRGEGRSRGHRGPQVHEELGESEAFQGKRQCT